MADLARRMFAVLAIVIVIIPVAVGAPTMLVFIPPAVRAAPATLTRFVQLMASFVRLAAVASMMLDGLENRRAQSLHDDSWACVDLNCAFQVERQAKEDQGY